MIKVLVVEGEEGVVPKNKLKEEAKEGSGSDVKRLLEKMEKLELEMKTVKEELKKHL